MTRVCSTRRLDSRRRRRPGLTMIELLIVVAVMVILMGIALPMMKTGIEGRKLREAARQVNTDVTLAKALAAETGQLSGLVIDTEPLPEDPTKMFARRLYLAEMPPPYAGDLVGAKAYVNGDQVTFDNALLGAYPADSSNIGLLGIRDGDLIKFDFRNPVFTIVDPDPTTDYAITTPFPGTPPSTDGMFKIAITPGMTAPPTGVYPYQIVRKPRKSSSTPLELPKGAVIDLNASGFGLTDTSLASSPRPWTASTYVLAVGCRFCQPTVSNGFWYVVVVSGVTGAVEPTWPTTVGNTVTDGTVIWKCVSPVPLPVTLVFGPSGQLADVMGVSSLVSSPIQTLHLLIGNLENLGNENLADRDTLWVSVGHHTGRVTTTESGPPAASLWKSSSAYSLGFYCWPTLSNGFWYCATTAGTSNSSEPTWPTTVGATVVDGGVTWECRAPPVAVAREFAQLAQGKGGL